MPLLVIVRPFVHLPDQQTALRHVAVVVRAGGLAILQQEILLPGQRNLVDLAALDHVLDAQIAHALRDLHHLHPSQLRQRPGAKGVRAVFHPPAQGPQPHQSPFADPGAVLLRLQFAVGAHRTLVEQIRQSQHMPELVAHGRRGDAEYVSALRGAPKAGKAAADADKSSINRRIVADVVGVQSQRSQAGRRAHEKVPGHGEQVDEDDIDVAVVVPRIGHAIRSIVVEPAHVDIGVGLLQDLQIEPPELTQRARRLRQVGVGGPLRAVAPGQNLPVHAQLPPGHLVVKVSEASRSAAIEQIRRPGGRLIDALRFPLKLGEDHQRAQAARSLHRQLGRGE